MTWILLTNDDGIDAPGLPSFAAALRNVATTRVVVPHVERSWVGKAITRFEPVEIEEVRRGGIEMYAATGYPADCVQLGIHTMFAEPPVLVVSGINIGQNHGSAFIQGSGTVGAVIEAAIAGVDGIAFSAGTNGDFHQWRRRVTAPESLPMWERLAALATEMTRVMLDAGPQGATISVNLPDHSDSTTERRLTTVAETGYDRLFRPDGPGRYVHDFTEGLTRMQSLEGTDVGAARDGAVSVTALRGIHGVGLPAGLSGLIEPAGRRRRLD